MNILTRAIRPAHDRDTFWRKALSGMILEIRVEKLLCNILELGEDNWIPKYCREESGAHEKGAMVVIQCLVESGRPMKSI